MSFISLGGCTGWLSWSTDFSVSLSPRFHIITVTQPTQTVIITRHGPWGYIRVHPSLASLASVSCLASWLGNVLHMWWQRCHRLSVRLSIPFVFSSFPSTQLEGLGRYCANHGVIIFMNSMALTNYVKRCTGLSLESGHLALLARLPGITYL